MSVYDKAHELARMLRESAEYQGYTRARQALGAESTARSILIDYRKNQIQVQAARMTGKEPPGPALKELERLGGIIDMHKPVSDFLRAENRLLTLLADIQKILGQSLDIWDYDQADTGF